MTVEIFRDQKHFREMIKSLSYPGRINKFIAIEKYRGNLMDSTIELALTLLDGEVTLCIVGDLDKSFEEISIRTNTKKETVENGDFIIIPLSEKEKISNVLKIAKKGDLLNPQKSATCIIEVEDINSGDEMIWTGPGIKDHIDVRISDGMEWINARNDAVSNFPLGIDIFIIDKNENLIGLPRSTKVKVKGE